MQYKRDKRSPVPKNATVSKVMSANKSKNSKPELALRSALYKAGIRGYRIHFKKLVGNPDIVWPGKRKALFVHGCFWHRCQNCNYSTPKTNSDYWLAKFEKNIARDRRNLIKLRDDGWDVLVLWECQIKESLEYSVKRSINFLSHPAQST